MDLSTSLCVPSSGPRTTLSLETVTTVEGVAALKPHYDHLLAVVGNTLPFALHDWHLIWCRHFLNRSPNIEDQALFHVLFDAARECVGIVPLIVSRRQVGPLRIVAVSLLGADPALTEIRSPVIKEGYEFLAARAVQTSVKTLLAEWDWIHWTGMNESFAEGLDDRADLLWQRTLKNYVLDMPATWEKFRASLKRNIRQSLRHGYNSLARDGHRFELQVASQPSEMGGALEAFFSLHAKRSHLPGTVPHPDYFASQPMRDFLCEVCEVFASREAVRVFQLNIGGQIVAARIGFVAGANLYLYYSGFDPTWARYGVMTTLVAESIKYSIAAGFKTVDLAAGKDVSKTRWRPREVQYREAFQHNSRLRSQIACQAYVKALSGEGFQGKLLKRLMPVARRFWS